VAGESILIVEDNDSNLRLFTYLLSSKGYDVRGVGDAPEALQLLSAHAMRGDEEKALAAGCDGYITKPIDTRAFPAQIAEFLAKGPRGGAPDEP